MDESRRLTRRKRKYLKLFTLFQEGKSRSTYQEAEYRTESARAKGTQVDPSDHQGGAVGHEPGHTGVVPAGGRDRSSSMKRNTTNLSHQAR